MTIASRTFRPIRDDHRRVLARLDALERTVAAGRRRIRLSREAQTELHGLVTLLFRQFATHMAAEERVLYPALVEAFPGARTSLEPLEHEHAEMRSMLLRLDELLGQPAGAARDEPVIVQAQDLVELLRIHIRKEEQSVLNVASRVLTPDEMARLDTRLAAHRDAMGVRTPRRAQKGSSA